MLRHMRRLTCILSGLVLFHLTLVGPDVTCAQHGETGAHETAPNVSAHVEHGAPLPTDAAGHDETDCEVPSLPACCQALASCGVSIAEAGPAQSRDLSHLAAGVLSGVEGTPASWTVEPDPPPPKA